MSALAHLAILSACGGDTTSTTVLLTDDPTTWPTPDDSGTFGGTTDTGFGRHTGDSGTTEGGTTPGDTAFTGDTGAAPTDTAAPPLPSGPIVVYAMRHAEKQDTGSDPGLTPVGLARADALATLLHEEPVAAAYATHWLRTQQTVLPTAVDHLLAVDTGYEATVGLATHILATHANQTVVHAGHSYTIQDFLGALGVVDPPSPSGYGQLWIVTIEPDGTATYIETTVGDTALPY